MLTITQLARQFKISRTTVLYYEREGLLLPASRSDNGYRWYGEAEARRLENILAFRAFGIPVSQLKNLLDHQEDHAVEGALHRQFQSLEQQVMELRRQQAAIMSLLGTPELLENDMLTKERWVDIMRASGMSDEDMTNWHRQFEKMEPQAHQEFLESLNISPEEIQKIREHSRN